jgi:hypothetical protein
MTRELVVAAYDKDVSWVNQLDKNIKITIYRKGNVINSNNDEIIITPNVGRCVHTFFRHLYVNYDNLADITFFAQDYPFDHWEDIIHVINNNLEDKKCQLQIGGYFGFHFNTIQTPSEKGGVMWKLYPTHHHGKGNVLVCSSNGYPHDKNPNLNVNKYWKHIFLEGLPDEDGFYEFIPGGHFGITKNHVHLRSKKVYEQIVNFLEKDLSAPWMIERLECYIFNPKYTTKF